MIDATSLIVPAFIAGILTFLAPCTLPLVPAYLGFISGASAKDMQNPRLASSTATVWQGAFLLGIFSLGLAIPFLLIAWGVGYATKTIRRLSVVLPYVSFVGGVLLIALGVLLLTDQLGIWLSWTYRLFEVFQYDRLLDYL